MPRATAAPSLPDHVEPVIDLNHLCGFTDGDPQLEGELLTLFLSSADVYLARLADALRAGQSWAASAHALKGASANLGARRVLALALTAEHAPPSAAQLEALRQAIDEVRAFRDSGRSSFLQGMSCGLGPGHRSVTIPLIKAFI